MKTVYRIIQYKMNEEHIEQQLDNSLADGVHSFCKGESITIVTLDEDDISLPIKTFIDAQLPIVQGCITRQHAREILKRQKNLNYAKESSISSNRSS